MNVQVLQHIRQQRAVFHAVKLRRPARRIKRPLPRQIQPDHIRLAYFAALRRLVLLPAKALVDQRLIPELKSIVSGAGIERAGAKTDADPSDVNDIMEGVGIDFFDQLSSDRMEDLAIQYAMATASYQKEQLNRQLQAAVGVPVPIADPRLGPMIKVFTAQNVALIKSIPQRYFGQVETKVLQGITEGKRWEEIATDLEDRFEVSEATAQLIARDQVGKMFGSLNEARQTDLGVERYIWRTANDNRVREEHADREGESFDWEDPPDDGHPGEPINCRCFAEPDLSSILDDL